MVKYGLVSVGLLVEPKRSPESSPKPLTLGLEYRPDMSDLVIKVSDHDNDSSNDESDHPDSNKSGGSSTKSYRMLERVDSGGARERNSPRNTTRNRPSCRKSRSDSQLSDKNNQNSSRSNREPTSGSKNTSSSAYKSCEYYRQKFLQESLQETSEYSDWMNLGAIKKTAGQKVVQKLAAQQKALEAEAEQQRKKVMLNPNNSGSDCENSSASSKDFVPPKKKPGKLDPIQITVQLGNLGNQKDNKFAIAF